MLAAVIYLLYLSFTGFAVVFAMGMAALVTLCLGRAGYPVTSWGCGGLIMNWAMEAGTKRLRRMKAE